VALNGRALSAANFSEERMKRLVEREFNLSWAEARRSDNALIAGRWWDRNTTAGEFSVESWIAAQLGLKLGDQLTFTVAGTPVTAPITSIRKVDWDSFQVNFYVIATPVTLRNTPASVITSLHLPAGEDRALDPLIRAMPNLTVIDAAAIVEQIRQITDQIAAAVEFVVLFTLASGLVVLYAAVAATQDERRYESALLRILGARSRHVVMAQVTEFLSIGLMASIP
jgi:putative ABC transport system permease protein